MNTSNRKKPAGMPYTASAMEKLMLRDLKAWLAAKEAIRKAKERLPGDP